jgi:phosphotransferase system HPr (HPr) family protein
MSESVQQRTVVIRSPQGLHARPAEMLARLASSFESEIELVRDNHRVDAKSILHVLTLGAVQGTELVVEARGSDAADAADALANLVESDFSHEYSLSRGASRTAEGK